MAIGTEESTVTPGCYREERTVVPGTRRPIRGRMAGLTSGWETGRAVRRCRCGVVRALVTRVAGARRLADRIPHRMTGRAGHRCMCAR